MYQIFSRNMGFLHILVNAQPVGHGGDGAHGPARSTSALVPDLLDGRTVGPLLARVELLWDVFNSHQVPLRLWHVVHVFRVDTHQGAKVVERGFRVEVAAGFPRHAGARVELLDEGVGHNVVVVDNAGSGGGRRQEK